MPSLMPRRPRTQRLGVIAVVAALLVLALSACDPAPSDSGAAVAIEPGVSLALAEHRARVLSNLAYDLALSIPAEATQDITGRIAISFDLANADQALQLDFREDEAHLKTVRANDRDIDIDFREEHLILATDHLIAGTNRIEIEFLAGSTSLNRNPDFLYSLFVPDRARTAFPVFDQPDLKAHWDLSLELPGAWAAMSSASIADTVEKGDRKTVRFTRSERLSTYVFSFIAGRFDLITREIQGRPMTLLHREPDAQKVARNADEIFRLHEAALGWLADYTGIPLPYEKLDIALIPAHPYGGMEHAGAIQYRADRLWLDEGASDRAYLRRASLIAHEVAHMWFGNLVTMRWFDDVWTKEVFANFMAAKIVNPSFPDIDHDLNFLLGHHPGAYSIDRTAGANAIRQPLENLNQAGQLYGPIIYDKAPIMMRQLERLLGESAFQAGTREYLERFSHANASWPELIEIYDTRVPEDVADWSDTWVNSPGRPVFELETDPETVDGDPVLRQKDRENGDRTWPQSFQILDTSRNELPQTRLSSRATITPIPEAFAPEPGRLILNSDGYGYGLFPADAALLDDWRRFDDFALAALLINVYEQMLEGADPKPPDYLPYLLEIATGRDNQLLINLCLGQLERIYWTLITDEERRRLAPEVEGMLWRAMNEAPTSSLKKLYFHAYAALAHTSGSLQRLADIWSSPDATEGLPLSERDLIGLTETLAIKDPERAEEVVLGQLERMRNPDERRRLEFLARSLSPVQSVRDTFFRSLADPRNRETESWVLDAVANLHHPVRVGVSEAYLAPSLELLEEIQATGDIFFPAGWLRATLRHHHSDRAVAMIDAFLDARPDYNPQLRLKLLQAADPVYRANRLRR